MPEVAQYAPCRQCVNCEGVDHHWIPDCDEDGAPVMKCKHCPTQRPLGENEDPDNPDFIARRKESGTQHGCDICSGAHSNEAHLANDNTPLDPRISDALFRIAARYEARKAKLLDNQVVMHAELVEKMCAENERLDRELKTALLKLGRVESEASSLRESLGDEIRKNDELKGNLTELASRLDACQSSRQWLQEQNEIEQAAAAELQRRLDEALEVLRPIAVALNQGIAIEPGSFSHDEAARLSGMVVEISGRKCPRCNVTASPDGRICEQCQRYLALSE